MPRSHGVLKTEVWEAVSDFRRLDLDAQWAFAMLISQPLINNVGVLPYVPEKWVRLAAGLDQERLQAALRTLEEQRYIVIDEATGELLVRTFIRHDAVWKQPKLVTNARRLIREVESESIRGYLADRHPWLVDETWSADKIRRHETRRRAPETPSDTPRDTPSDTPLENPGENERVTEGVTGAPRAYARDGLPLDQPLPQPQTGGSTTAAARHDDPAAAAADVLERIDDLGLNGRARELASAEPDRAQAWLDLAEHEAQRNPAAFVLSGLRSGEWPSQRGPLKRRRRGPAPCAECGVGGGQHAAGCPHAHTDWPEAESEPLPPLPAPRERAVSGPAEKKGGSE